MHAIFSKLVNGCKNSLLHHSVIGFILFLVGFGLYGYSISGYIFACMLVVFVRGLVIDLLAKPAPLIQAYASFLKSVAPYIALYLIFGFLLKIKPSVFLSASCVLFLFSMLISSVLYFFQKFLPNVFAQVIAGVIVLFLFTSNYFFIGLVQNFTSFETQSLIYYALACANPLMMIVSYFGVDIFHANQLYQVFGSVFLVEKLELMQLAKAYLIFGVFFYIAGALLPDKNKRKEEEV